MKAPKAPAARAAASSAAARAQPSKITYIPDIYGYCAFKPYGDGLDVDVCSDRYDIIGSGVAL